MSLKKIIRGCGSDSCAPALQSIVIKQTRVFRAVNTLMLLSTSESLALREETHFHPYGERQVWFPASLSTVLASQLIQMCEV